MNDPAETEIRAIAQSLAGNLTKQQSLFAGYDYDPAVPLPTLSETEKEQLSQLPIELFQHVVEDRKSKCNPQLNYLKLYISMICFFCSAFNL
jgi:hypothetical protein